VAAKWNRDGTYFATASADNSLRIYRQSDAPSTSTTPTPVSDTAPSALPLGTYCSVHEVVYKGEVTAIDWVKGKNLLLVAVREDNYLHEIDITTLTETNKYNMNLTSWDDHVSFTVLDLAVSNDDRMVVASTGIC
jgi:WD40 repeat protein